MSSNEVALNNGQQAIVNFDVSKIFVYGNRYAKANYTNSDSYDSVDLPAGTVMGRIAATGEVVPCASGASDGSQFPIGVLAQDYTVEAGDTVEVYFCVAGDVVESKLVFDGSDDLDTVISSKTMRDRIGSDSVGIKLVPSTELTAEDNQ